MQSTDFRLAMLGFHEGYDSARLDRYLTDAFGVAE